MEYKGTKLRVYPVEYAGWWHIQTNDNYQGRNVLDADRVGKDIAKINAETSALGINLAQKYGSLESLEKRMIKAEEERDELMDMNKPWSMIHAVKKLVEAADILLHEKNYDGHGWEQITDAQKAGKEFIEKISKEKWGELEGSGLDKPLNDWNENTKTQYNG